MRFLVIYAHPAENSFQAALHRRIVKVLAEAGHDVDDCDLYAEGFLPVLNRDEWRIYHDTNANRRFAHKEIERILKCQGLVLVFPTCGTACQRFSRAVLIGFWCRGLHSR